MVRLRAGVMVIWVMMRSKLDASSPGISPSQTTGTCSSLTFMSAARRSATSASKPMIAPSLERIAPGGRVGTTPTRSVPRFLICSSALFAPTFASCADATPTAPAAASSAAATTVLMICLMSNPPLSLRISRGSQTPLQQRDQYRQAQRHRPVDRGDGEPDLEGEERVGDDVAALVGELEHRDHAQHRRRLDQ